MITNIWLTMGLLLITDVTVAPDAEFTGGSIYPDECSIIIYEYCFYDDETRIR
jgi:hypothetical protein